MNWLQRARLEMQRSARRPTANTAERTLTAVMAVPDPGVSTESAPSIGSNGGTPAGDSVRLHVEGRTISLDNDDRRRCTDCTNLTTLGNCLAAWRGDLAADRDYKPMADILRRCEGYIPKVHDPDQRPGRERWRGLPTQGVDDGN
jgi:hypothetical protein